MLPVGVVTTASRHSQLARTLASLDDDQVPGVL